MGEGKFCAIHTSSKVNGNRTLQLARPSSAVGLSQEYPILRTSGSVTL